MNGATNEQLNALSKPVPAAHVKLDDRKNKHTTARFVMNRLDSTVGKANWRDEYSLMSIGEEITMECTLYIRIEGEWVGKTDNGGPPETYSKEKSLYSNALKRAAFKWGIARELYGEGNYYVPEEAEPQPAPETPAQDAGAGNGDDVEVWTGKRVEDFEAWAEREFVSAGFEAKSGTHARNRIALALGLPSKSYNHDALAEAMRRECADKGTKEVVQMVQTYLAQKQEQAQESDA